MKRSKRVYQVKGDAIDQETIIRLRPKMEDYVREDLSKTFKKTDLKWNMNEKGFFTFTLNFYA
jgi:hypothetical protein